MEQLTTALGPAFAAGFAVQRLLEILDPIVNRLVKEEDKKITLGLVSLLAGMGLSFGVKLTVLDHLGLTVDKYLDYLVAGLIISAGTEGFNSILKFLSYKKEEKKAEAAAEKVSASRSLASAGNSTASTSFERAALAPVGAADVIAEDDMAKKIIKDGMTLDDGLEASLMLELKRRFESKFTEVKWKKRPFSRLTNDVDDAKVAVLQATRRIAAEVNLTMSKEVERNLQRQIDLTTTPEDALPLMREALDFADSNV
ncbi:MAG: hypothetical protein ACJ754_06290 [Pyrinomonadaceae bacterium]